MKFIVAGQKKNSFFHSRKNRVLFLPIIAIATAFLLPFIGGGEQVFDWETLIQLLIFFVFIELVVSYLYKEEKTEGLVSIDFKDNSIELTYFSGEATVLAHDQIQAIHKDVTKIVIDVKNKKKVYGIPYSYFEYEQIQNIKSEVDKVSKMISVPSIQNTTFS